MSGEITTDALPYFDSGYEEPGAMQIAFALVEEETKRYRPTKNYLEHLGPANYHAFETDISKNEFERISNRLPMEMLSMRRYEIPGPPSGKTTDLSAWCDAVNNSYAQLEHQYTRLLNLEVMAKCGGEAWKMYNNVLQTMFDNAQKILITVRHEIQEINRQRQEEQVDAGKKLTMLENSWVGLVSKNYEIECAISDLRKKLNAESALNE